MADTAEQQIQKLRQESAGWRTKYAPFRDAFEGLSDEAIDWVLQTVVMAKSDIPTERVEAGKRYLQLSHANMGEDFLPIVSDLIGVADPTTLGEFPEVTPAGDLDMDEAMLDEKLQAFGQEMMKAVGGMFQQTQEQTQAAQRQQQVQDVLNEVKSLKYDPDDWRGKLLMQVAIEETNLDINAAHALMIERGTAPPEVEPTGEAVVTEDGTRAPVPAGSGAELTAAQQLLQSVNGVPADADAVPQVPAAAGQPVEGVNMGHDDGEIMVPATGGTTSGGGPPDALSEPPTSFGQASDALREALESSLG